MSSGFPPFVVGSLLHLVGEILTIGLGSVGRNEARGVWPAAFTICDLILEIFGKLRYNEVAFVIQ